MKKKVQKKKGVLKMMQDRMDRIDEASGWSTKKKKVAKKKGPTFE
jgi:hypothetical protein